MEYRKPKVVDYGDLKTVTAGNASGQVLDKSFPVHTPKQDLTFSG
jgi:hypothetical protein